ncbi:MAG: sugar phosphate isomerase/epimerase family protein [Phycisphaerales bacterium JB037]
MGVKLNRREFGVRALGVGAAGMLAGPAAAANAAGSRRREPDPLPFSISLAEWSLHRTIYGGELDHLDFARTARERYDLDAVEYVTGFFKDKATDAAYINEMKKRASDHGVRSLLIMVDGEGALGAENRNERRKSVENHIKWLDAAAALGCHSIRVNAHSSGSYQEQIGRAADGLRQLCELGEERGLNVIVENHGGLSSNGHWLSTVMRAVDHPRVGTLPDFGNFRIQGDEWYDRYRGVKELMPFAKAVSAKSHAFGPDGLEMGTDYPRMMGIVLAAGYHGFVGIEYEGSKHPEYEGVRLTLELLKRIQGERRGG